MIDKLGSILDTFPGSTNQTRCFLHIITLVAKSVLCQFELPKASDKDLLSEGAKELVALAEDLEANMDDHNGEDNDDDELEDDNDDEEQGECEGMSDEEIAKLEECVQPVRLVLGKASCFKLSFKLLFTHTMCSCTRSLLRLKTLPLSSFPNGFRHWRNLTLGSNDA